MILELPGGTWRHHKPAPLSSSQLHVYLLCQRCPRSTYLLYLICCWSKPWTFIPEGDLSPRQGSLSADSSLCGQPLADLEQGAHRVHRFFFSLANGKMTLKSNKNEPAVILESVNSVRTALSDLYLEQLLQHKPKSDKVGVVFKKNFPLPPRFWCLLPGSREKRGGHMTVVCSSTRSLKIDPAVFPQ